jgi:hypothetical protein
MAGRSSFLILPAKDGVGVWSNPCLYSSRAKWIKKRMNLSRGRCQRTFGCWERGKHPWHGILSSRSPYVSPYYVGYKYISITSVCISHSPSLMRKFTILCITGKGLPSDDQGLAHGPPAQLPWRVHSGLRPLQQWHRLCRDWGSRRTLGHHHWE